MKPAWDKLMKEYAGHASALVADVDCTAAGKPLCDANGVRGFPTIKYGDPSDLQAYEGGRDFDALKKFADDNLKPSWSPANLELCDDAKKAEIAELSKLSDDELDTKIEEGNAQMKDAEDTFKSEVEKLQKKYQELTAEKDQTLEDVKNSGLGMMKSVRAFRKKQGEDKDEL